MYFKSNTELDIVFCVKNILIKLFYAIIILLVVSISAFQFTAPKQLLTRRPIIMQSKVRADFFSLLITSNLQSTENQLLPACGQQK